MQDKERRGMYAKIAIAKKQLGLDEDSYRAFLVGEFGKKSAKDLNRHELARLLQKFASLGVCFTAKGTNKEVTPHSRPDWIEITNSMPFAKQKREILAIWRKLGYSMSSLDTRINRQCQAHSFVWLQDEEQIKALLCDLQKREKAFERKPKYVAVEDVTPRSHSNQKAACGENA